MTKPNDSQDRAIRLEESRKTARSIHQQAVKLQQEQGITYIESLGNQRQQLQQQRDDLQRKLEGLEQSRLELLAALRQTLDALLNETHGKQDSAWISSVKGIAKAAIAAAEGRAL